MQGRHGELVRKAMTRAGIIFAGYLLVCGWVFVSPGRNTAPDARITPAVREGARIWRRENCVACHALYGLGGHSGPDLVSVVKTYHTVHYARALIQNGNPKRGMPAFDLSGAELDALCAYLEYLDATGAYPLRSEDYPDGRLPVFGARP